MGPRRCPTGWWKLTDQAALDQWAAEQTGGLIDKFPPYDHRGHCVGAGPALTARVRWRTPSRDPRVRGDNWDGDPGPADQQWLSRTTSDLVIAAVPDEAVTRVVVEGDGDVDVHLLIGADQPPAETSRRGPARTSGQAQAPASRRGRQTAAAQD